VGCAEAGFVTDLRVHDQPAPGLTKPGFTPYFTLAQKVRGAYPDTFARVRAACGCAAKGIDLDNHAARITLEAVDARSRPIALHHLEDDEEGDLA
jgi:hypothetical protein